MKVFVVLLFLCGLLCTLKVVSSQAWCCVEQMQTAKCEAGYNNYGTCNRPEIEVCTQTASGRTMCVAGPTSGCPFQCYALIQVTSCQNCAINAKLLNE